MCQARYEFRVFGRDLDQTRHLLEQTATCSDQEAREDVYFFVQRDPKRAVKLRGGTSLDCKRLISVDREFEKWKPCGKIDLPIAAPDLSDWLRKVGEKDLDFGHGLLCAGDVMKALSRSGVKDIVRVGKDRTKYQIDGVTAEFTHLLIDDTIQHQTIAIESASLTALMLARDSFGLGRSINTSYPAWLKVYCEGQVG